MNYQVNEFAVKQRNDQFKADLRNGLIMLGMAAVLVGFCMFKVVEILAK